MDTNFFSILEYVQPSFKQTHTIMDRQGDRHTDKPLSSHHIFIRCSLLLHFEFGPCYQSVMIEVLHHPQEHNVL